jgi:SAM-dependent methyltransferase
MLVSSNERLESLLRQWSGAPKLILEVGCGAWENRPVLVRCFPAARLFGVDLRPLTAPGFVQADIRRLPFATPFDLVLIRHPDVHRSGVAWETFLRQSRRWLTPSGLFMITAYSAAEVETIRGWLPPLTPTPLDASRLAPVPLDGQDRYYFVLSLPLSSPIVSNS